MWGFLTVAKVILYMSSCTGPSPPTRRRTAVVQRLATRLDRAVSHRSPQWRALNAAFNDLHGGDSAAVLQNYKAAVDAL